MLRDSSIFGGSLRALRRVLSPLRSGGHKSATTTGDGRPTSPCQIESLEGRTMLAASPFVADSQGRLMTVNLSTGATHVIATMNVVMFDIAQDHAGNLYGVDSRSNLYKINKTTAVATKIGAVGFFVNALTFASNGTLYAAGYGKFLKISTKTGAGTLIGNLGSSLNSAGDLAFDSSGKLYLTTTSDKLVRVSLTTGKATIIGSIGFHQVYGLGFSGGVMYGVSNYSEQAFNINLTTGRGTLLSNFGKSPVVGANGATFQA